MIDLRIQEIKNGFIISLGYADDYEAWVAIDSSHVIRIITEILNRK